MEHYFTNNDSLASKFLTIIYKYEDYYFEFTSDLGVFSKDRVDYGSRLLMETFFKRGRRDAKLLDVGCGYGIIGLTISKVMNTKPTLIDVNRRAVHLSAMNAKSLGIVAETKVSDIYSEVTDKYDVIVTNPPIRAGKDVVMEILLGAKEYLNPDGELWCVMRKDQGAKSAISKMKEIYDVDVINKSKGFYIIVAKCY